MIATPAIKLPKFTEAAIGQPLASNFLFNFYVSFVVVHFLRLSSRVPVLGAMRITILMVLVMVIGLIANKEQLRGRLVSEPRKWLIALAIYIVLTLPLVKWPGSVLQITLQVWILSTLFFFFTLLVVDSLPRLKTFVTVFFLCQIVRVLEPLFLHITQGYWGSQTYVGDGEFMARLAGGPHDVVNPNGLAFVIVSIIPFLAYLSTGARWTGKITKLVSFAILGALIYALVLTSSRSGMLALGVVVVAIFMKSKNKVLFLAIVIAGISVTMGGLNDLQRDRYLSIFSSDTRSGATADGRIQGLKDEVTLAMQRPIFGHGLGTSGEAKYHFFGRFQVAHDLYTELVIDLGIIGLVLFLLFLRATYHTIRDLRRKLAHMESLSDDDREYLRALTDAIEVWGLMCIIVSLAYFGLMEWHWYLIGGISVAAARVVSTPSRNIDAPAPKAGNAFRKQTA